MDSDKYISSNAKHGKIKAIQFSLLSNEEIVSSSVVLIEHPDLYEKGVPKSSGLYDLRMGTTDKQYKCQTCNCDVINCPGHFGHITLEEPVYNTLYIKTVYKILQCICIKCSSFLSNTISVKHTSAISQLKHCTDNITKYTICHKCNFKQYKISFEAQKIMFTLPDNEQIHVTAKMSFHILRKLSPGDVVKLGFSITSSHPKDMIFISIPVPPPVVRPSIIIDSVMKSQDDLTHKLSEILKCNSQIKKTKENNTKSGTSVLEELINLLQFHIDSYIDNELPGQPQATQRTGRPIKSLCQRIKSKEGRVRGNLMGKRVDFSARTVITADPNLYLDELGVPETIAKNMTIPEHVTDYNIKKIEQMISGNSDTNVKYIINTKGIRKDLRFLKNPTVEVGDIVERNLQNGDYVVFNRQPSLHKMSMMGHKIKIMPYSTFRLNLSATSPYNADFDGDEMNMHVPQNQETRTEIKELMMVSHCIVSPQSNKPVMGIVQDALLASRLLTMRDKFIDKMTMMDIITRISKNTNLPKPAISKPKELWTGKQLINLIVPKINFKRYSGWHNENDESKISTDDTEVLIENGELISGILCKKTLGSSSGSLIHLIWLEMGPEDACLFISEIQFIVNAWLMTHGFTCSISDMINHIDTQNKVDSIVQDVNKKVIDIIDKGYKECGEIKRVENKINTILNTARDQAGICVQEKLNHDNNIYSMVSGGSKGSVINISQIMACVGQQNVNGNRISFGYNKRTLPHFCKNDISAESKGFIKHSYIQGLNPTEFFFHAMAGREGVIDTAVKTSETGYIQRRLVKAMEDITITGDGSVRNSMGDILQIQYGEDGMDASRLITQKLPNINKHFDDIQYVSKNTDLILWEHNEIIEARNMLQYSNVDRVHLPIDMFRTLSLAKYIKTGTFFDCEDDIIKGLQNFCKFIENNILLKSIIIITLSSKIVIHKHKLTSDGLTWMLDTIKYTYESSLVNRGEMVGTIAAQSLGEPITQLTLNTFHSAGISEKNVTLGVPRLKEIINTAKNIKSPSMTIFLDTKSDVSLKDLTEKITRTDFNTFVTGSSILYNADYLDFEKHYYEYIDSSIFCPWCIHINYSSKILEKLHISIYEITMILMNMYENVHIIPSHENSDNPILVFRFSKNDINYDELLTFLNTLLYDTILFGNSKITKVFKKDEYTLETDGSVLLDILGIDGVDKTSTFSNDIVEIYNVLGIEAARSAILNEIRNVIEFDGSYVNYRHICLLVETMTNKGKLMAITRHGINRTMSGPLMKCSFEETINVLIDATINSEKDELKGVTENIMLGKITKSGTGCVDLHLDMDKLTKNDHIMKYTIKERVYKTDTNKHFIPSSPSRIST